MKKLLLITVLAILVVAATAQETRKTFCEIVGTGKVLSSKVKIQIDFGQKTSYFGKYKTFMVDESGKKIEFNSMVDAMNYLAKFRWKFEQAYVVTNESTNQNVYHWLLSKDIVSDDEIREGIITQKDFEDMEKAAMEDKENKNEEVEKKVPLFMRNMKRKVMKRVKLKRDMNHENRLTLANSGGRFCYEVTNYRVDKFFFFR